MINRQGTKISLNVEEEEREYERIKIMRLKDQQNFNEKFKVDDILILLSKFNIAKGNVNKYENFTYFNENNGFYVNKNDTSTLVPKEFNLENSEDITMKKYNDDGKSISNIQMFRTPDNK